MLALHPSSFDVIICSRVLCFVNDAEMMDVLCKLRKLIHPNGKLILTVCNIFHASANCTALAERIYAENDLRTSSSQFLKRHNITGNGHQEYHRPLHVLRRALLRSGFEIESTIESPRSVDLTRFESCSEMLLFHCRPRRSVDVPALSMSLMIKACAMDWRTLASRVRHIVRTLEGPHVFQEIVVSLDGQYSSFPRSHDQPCSHAELLKICQDLRQQGLIDRIVDSAELDSNACKQLNKRWLGVDLECTHAHNGGPIASFFNCIESMSPNSDLILQVDSDLMLSRSNSDFDYLQAVSQVFQLDSRALTLSLNIFNSDPSYFTPTCRSNAGNSWRTEVRGCIFHVPRLQRALPLNWSADPTTGLSLPWHRILDQTIASRPDVLCSVRGVDMKFCFVHPPNTAKQDVDSHMQILDAIALCKGKLPAQQDGMVDLNSAISIKTWLASSARHEDYVFVVAGHGVQPGRILRCIDSISRQIQDHMLVSPEISCGIVLIADHNTSRFDDQSRQSTENVNWDDVDSYLRHLILTHPLLRKCCTLLMPGHRRGSLRNTITAVRDICTNPCSVIVLVDLDDCLIGSNLISRLESAFHIRGAEIVVGGMLRTDKRALAKSWSCPTYDVTFHNVRSRRGAGNVWSHLRAFRQWLFPADDESMLSDGKYIELASDWRFMLPMVESAWRRESIDKPVYLYEPFVPVRANVYTVAETQLKHHAQRAERVAEREAVIAQICSMPPRPRFRPVVAVIGNANFAKISDPVVRAFCQQQAREVGAALVTNGYRLLTGGKGGVMEAASSGAAAALWTRRNELDSNQGDAMVLAVLPEDNPHAANPFVSLPIHTGIGQMRNSIIATLADAVVVIGGGSGACLHFISKFVEFKMRRSIFLFETFAPFVSNGRNFERSIVRLVKSLSDHCSRRDWRNSVANRVDPNE